MPTFPMINTNKIAMAFCGILTDVFIHIILYKGLDCAVIRRLWLRRRKVETVLNRKAAKGNPCYNELNIIDRSEQFL